MRRMLATGLVLMMAAGASADVKLPSIFSDHMVIQAGEKASVWGWADAGENVTVTVGDQSVTAEPGAGGKWMAKLPALKASDKPTTLTVKGKNTLTINDVLVGEVWLCSGQSNMAMTVNRAKDYEQEMAKAKLPAIRMFITERKAMKEPQENCSGKWVVCSPETVGTFSATAFFFGRELHETLKTPVGLINSSVGGTPIEAWISLEKQRSYAEFKPLLERWTEQVSSFDPEQAKAAHAKAVEKYRAAQAAAKKAGKAPPRAPRPPQDPFGKSPGVLFNGMIAPLVPYTVRGAIWYQGEANAGSNAHLYGKQLEALATDWRSRFGKEFPFAWVQLPNYRAAQQKPSETTGWVLVQEQMDKAARAIPNTATAMAAGTGEVDDIHPKNKQEVGRRLSLWALAKVYGRKLEGDWSGPLYRSMEIKGDKIILTLDHARGLNVGPNAAVEGFAIAGVDQQFVWAKAKIEGDKVTVWAEGLKEPKAVRYNWAENPVGRLQNDACLPAGPFRTDDWVK